MWADVCLSECDSTGSDDWLQLHKLWSRPRWLPPSIHLFSPVFPHSPPPSLLSLLLPASFPPPKFILWSNLLSAPLLSLPPSLPFLHWRCLWVFLERECFLEACLHAISRDLNAAVGQRGKKLEVKTFYRLFSYNSKGSLHFFFTRLWCGENRGQAAEWKRKVPASAAFL